MGALTLSKTVDAPTWALALVVMLGLGAAGLCLAIGFNLQENVYAEHPQDQGVAPRLEMQAVAPALAIGEALPDVLYDIEGDIQAETE